MTEVLPTADLYDEHGEALQICCAPLLDFGGRKRFQGVIRTVQCHEDNGLARALLSGPGQGAVLVVDAGGWKRCALIGDNLAGLALRNGWAGIVVNGAVRDAAALARMDLGVKALAATPRRGARTGAGEINPVVVFGDAIFTPGHMLYSDEDGLVVLPPEDGAA